MVGLMVPRGLMVPLMVPGVDFRDLSPKSFNRYRNILALSLPVIWYNVIKGN